MMEVGIYCAACFSYSLSDVIQAPLWFMKYLAPPKTIPRVFFMSTIEFMALGEALVLPVVDATFLCHNCDTRTTLQRREQE